MPKKNLGTGNTTPNKFRDRMMREGRWDEWAKTKEQVSSEEPTFPRDAPKHIHAQRGAKIIRETMKRMGYISAEHENSLYRAWKDQRDRDDTIKANGPTSTATTFDKALIGLPANADEGVENKWVRAHIALTRKQRQDDDTKKIRITGEDIINAAHGPCPSREAANKLQYWANHPQEVFKNLAVPMKNNAEGEASKETDVVEDVELAEVERLLKEVMSG